MVVACKLVNKDGRKSHGSQNIPWPTGFSVNSKMYADRQGEEKDGKQLTVRHSYFSSLVCYSLHLCSGCLFASLSRFFGKERRMVISFHTQIVHETESPSAPRPLKIDGTFVASCVYNPKKYHYP